MYIVGSNPRQATASIPFVFIPKLDLHFRAFKYSENELYQMLVKAFPDFDLYIRALKTMQPDDVKQLMKDIVAYFMSQPPHTTQGFVDATKPTFAKIVKSIEPLLSGMRRSFAPQ